MKEFIGEQVFLVVTTKAGHFLEYYGIVEAEDKESVTLKDVIINFGAHSYQTKIVNASIVQYKQNIDKAVVNKEYIVSCNKFKTK
jgi:hypothetical protein